MKSHQSQWKRPDRIRGLFKFGERTHMEELIHEGHLFMNTLSYYIELERDCLRADSDEGLDYTIAADGAALSMDHEGEWKPVGTIRGAIRHRKSDPREMNVYCMHTLREDITSVDPRNLEFGDTCVVFVDGDEFIRRVKLEARRHDLPISWNLVEYLDLETHTGPVGPFRKASLFAHQSEWRIVLNPGPGKPFSLRIGDVSDIARIGPLRDLNDRLQVVGDSFGIWGSP